MAETSRTEEIEPEKGSEDFPRPDETAWWEKQLGVPLPDAFYTEIATGR